MMMVIFQNNRSIICVPEYVHYAGIMRYLIRYSLPAKNALFLLFTEIFRRPLAKLTVCIVVFLNFAALTARGSYAPLFVINYCGWHQRCRFVKEIG